MRNKLFTLLSLSILTFVVLMSCVSATTIFFDDFNNGNLIDWTATSWSNAGTYAESTKESGAVLSKTISTSGFQNIIISYDRRLVGDWETGNNFTVSWSVDGTTFTALEEVVGSSEDNIPSDANFVPKTFNLSSSASANNNANFRLKFDCTTNALTEFCRLDNVSVEGTVIPATPDKPKEVESCLLTANSGDLRIKKIDITNNGLSSGLTFGKDDEWFPLENIEVQLDIKNYGDERINNIEIDWGIYDTDTNTWVIEPINEKDFDLKTGKTNTLTVSFNLNKDLDWDIDDLDNGDHYQFYVIATGEVDNDNASMTCVSDFKQVSFIVERNFVVLDNFEYSETMSCGSTVQIMADVWNIGKSDQDEVSVQVYNKELGISQIIEIGDIDAFDNEVMNLEFQVPQNAEEKWYALKFTVYDEDNSIYDYDNDESVFVLPVKVEGGCIVIPKVSISASLISGGMSGEQMVVKATVSNTGDSIKEYSLSATGYTSWASDVSLDAETFNLGAGQSKEVLFTFDVNKDASGTQLFDIEVVSEGQLELKQPVQVSITKKAGFLTGNIISEGNWYVWGIGALNVLLILIIIIVAIKVAKK